MALITLADFLIGAGGNGGGVADNTTQRASTAISKGSMAETGFAWERSFASFKQLIGWWGRGFRVMKSPESPGFEPQLCVTGEALGAMSVKGAKELRQFRDKSVELKRVVAEKDLKGRAPKEIAEGNY